MDTWRLGRFMACLPGKSLAAEGPSKAIRPSSELVEDGREAVSARLTHPRLATVRTWMRLAEVTVC